MVGEERGVLSTSLVQNRRDTCFAPDMREEYTVSFGRLHCSTWTLRSPCSSNLTSIGGKSSNETALNYLVAVS
ncbi:hypothetical protein TNCV_3977641 [Trichonephila clavipes]|nr:hypothetical protein TNCV_3977641 [Trichonephila clavipes]